MTVTAEYLVVDSGGFIKNDLGTLDAMADNIVTLHEVRMTSLLFNLSLNLSRKGGLRVAGQGGAAEAEEHAPGDDLLQPIHPGDQESLGVCQEDRRLCQPQCG